MVMHLSSSILSTISITISSSWQPNGLEKLCEIKVKSHWLMITAKFIKNEARNSSITRNSRIFISVRWWWVANIKFQRFFTSQNSHICPVAWLLTFSQLWLRLEAFVRVFQQSELTFAHDTKFYRLHSIQLFCRKSKCKRFSKRKCKESHSNKCWTKILICYIHKFWKNIFAIWWSDMNLSSFDICHYFRRDFDIKFNIAPISRFDLWRRRSYTHTKYLLNMLYIAAGIGQMFVPSKTIPRFILMNFIFLPHFSNVLLEHIIWVSNEWHAEVIARNY